MRRAVVGKSDAADGVVADRRKVVARVRIAPRRHQVRVDVDEDALLRYLSEPWNRNDDPRGQVGAYSMQIRKILTEPHTTFVGGGTHGGVSADAVATFQPWDRRALGLVNTQLFMLRLELVRGR